MEQEDAGKNGAENLRSEKTRSDDSARIED
jgi:hypothetical protein